MGVLNIKIDKLLMKYYGASKIRTIDKQLHKAGEKTVKYLENKFKL